MNTEAYNKMKQFCERFRWHLETMHHSLDVGSPAGAQMLAEAIVALAATNEDKLETRRHNEFGVELTGTPENLDKAMAALCSQPDLLSSCEDMKDKLTELFNNMDCTWNDWGESYKIDKALKRAEVK